MRLPNHEQAVIQPKKLKDYRLAHSHPIGRFKARFFRTLGFTDTNWQALEVQIRSLLDNDAIKKERTQYGQK